MVKSHFKTNYSLEHQKIRRVPLQLETQVEGLKNLQQRTHNQIRKIEQRFLHFPNSY